MAEVYIESDVPIYQKIYYAGEIVSADANVTATLYDITEDPGNFVEPSVPVVTLTAVKMENDIGNYRIILPYSLTPRNRKFKIVWSYTVNFIAATQVSYLDVVTPYAELSEAIEDLGIGVDPSDPNHKTYHQLMMAEKYARKLIEEYTGQRFSLTPDTAVAYGSGSDVLVLQDKIHDIYQLKGNDIMLVDNLADPITNNWIHTPMITENGFGIRVNRANTLDNTVYTANGMVPPTIYDDYGFGAFRKDVRYTVLGSFGWDRVPDNVQAACIVLMGDYFSKDRKWREKYVKNIQTFDWQFEYNNDAFIGTGNAYADQLLNPYVINSMVVI